MDKRTKFTLIFLLFLSVGLKAVACTSAIVAAPRTISGHTMMWKHRDTGTEHNFVERVSTPGHRTYVALFNGGDSLLREAWMGFNDAGFAIMNTASYNLAPDTATLKDCEGLLMRRALEVCTTVQDFINLLDTLPRPMGVQANFGVIDLNGNGGYFETDDYNYTPFLISPDTALIVRTNFSFTGNDTNGMGYIRYDNACHLIGDRSLSPTDFTQGLSCSFYHSLLKKDFLADTTVVHAVDQDFIPRRSSAASIVIETGATPADYKMYTVLGYPPVGEQYIVTLEDVPDDVRPLEPGFRARACNRTIERKHRAFPIKRGSGQRYVDLDYIRQTIGLK